MAPYGTFSEEEAPRRSSGRTVVALAALAACAFAGTAAVASSAGKKAVLVQQPQLGQKQMLAWGGFTNEMQDEADKALRLCSVGLLGRGQHCAKHVVDTNDSRFTHSEEGQNIWEESQRELNVQRSIVPAGAGGIGTPGDFGDR